MNRNSCIRAVSQNIVAFYGIAIHRNKQEQSTNLLMVMELGAASLKDWVYDSTSNIGRRRIRLREMVQLLLHIANGVEFLHSKGEVWWILLVLLL